MAYSDPGQSSRSGARTYRTPDDTGDNGRSQRPIGDLFSQLASDVSLLISQEIALAKKEFSQTLSQVASGAIWLAIGAVLAVVGLIALLTAAILALALIMPHWAAALLFGLIVLVIGGVLILSGINRLKQLKLIPERTVQTLKEDAEMIREKAQ